MNQLEALRQYTTVVADTGDFHQIARFRPQDATTNPSLIFKAVQQGAYQGLLHGVLRQHPGESTDALMDRLLVRFGCEILRIVPGRVSTEVDARLSFDTAATVARARRLVALYRAEGVDVRSRLLIKIAATWEGIQAARILEAEGIHTNLTLLFSRVQAIACADSGVRLISPFVGRIYDWHRQKAGTAWDEAAMRGAADPGVQSVRSIYRYFKRFGIATEVMGASFRNTAQILALAGCDLLTISPDLLAQLQAADAQQHPVPRVLLAQEDAQTLGTDVLTAPPENPLHYDEACFRYALNADAMASEKLAEGIRAFDLDTQKLLTLIAAGA